jgi:hypothetical protein
MRNKNKNDGVLIMNLLLIKGFLPCLMITVATVGCADKSQKSISNPSFGVSLAISADSTEEFAKQLTGTWKSECKKFEESVEKSMIMTTLIFSETGFTSSTRLYWPHDTNCVDESNDTNPWTRVGEVKLGPKSSAVSNAYEVEWIGGVNMAGTTCITYDILSIKDGSLSHGLEGGPGCCNTRDERSVELYEGKFTRVK